MKAAAALWSTAVIAIGLTQRHANAYGYGLLPRSSLVRSGQHHRVLSHSAEATTRHRPLRMAAGGDGFFAKIKSGWKESVEPRRLDALPDRARPGFGPSPSGINSKKNSVQVGAVRLGWTVRKSIDLCIKPWARLRLLEKHERTTAGLYHSRQKM